jgi:hypothetical protein
MGAMAMSANDSTSKLCSYCWVAANSDLRAAITPARRGKGSQSPADAGVRRFNITDYCDLWDSRIGTCVPLNLNVVAKIGMVRAEFD